MLLLELNRNQILARVDKKFIHHAEHLRDLPRDNTTGSIFQECWHEKVLGKTEIKSIWNTNSATYPGEKDHVQIVFLMGLADKIKGRKYDVKNLRNDVMDIVQNGDLRLGCSCESFLFFGYRYICTRLGVVAKGWEETRTPKIRNPHQKGIVCKHLALILSLLPNNSMKIISSIKDDVLPEINKGGKLKEDISLEERIKGFLRC